MFNLTFDQSQLQIINMALGEIPHKHAAPLIMSINQQILVQQERDMKARQDLDMKASAARQSAAESEVDQGSLVAAEAQLATLSAAADAVGMGVPSE